MAIAVRQGIDFDETNRLIAIPREPLRSADGRVLRIVEWHPHVVLDDCLRVTAEMIIERTRQEPQHG